MTSGSIIRQNCHEQFWTLQMGCLSEETAQALGTIIGASVVGISGIQHGEVSGKESERAGALTLKPSSLWLAHQ
jgi:hypothetical protein